MPIPALPLAIPVLQAAGNFLLGRKQARMAKNMKPSNYVPGAVQEAVDNTRLAANSMTAGYARAVETGAKSTASTIDNIKKVGGTPGSVQQAVADADTRQKEYLKDLAVSDEANRANNRQAYNSALMAKGDYQQRSMDSYNAAKSALTGASIQNQYNAFTNLGEGLVNALPDSAFSTSKPYSGGNVMKKINPKKKNANGQYTF